MATMSRFGLLAIAVVFHLVYIYSIVDIYFVSPIVSGMRLIPVGRPAGESAPADRLVLFVGDGLRADKAFQSFPEPYPHSDDDLVPRPMAPFLRSRVLDHGTFGVSHTRVPTESRPGHVALIAGLYEDVSAVTTGWKLNPVNFDSTFNRSRHTWSWGSPDILPMFEQGAVPGRVDAFTYGAELEDYSQDATRLDHWVFDHVKDLFASASTNETLDRALRQDKVVFFLHLLGLDSTGHSYRPYSSEYLDNIKVVDKGVQEITELVDQFYADQRTAFVFTADHGMSDWGSHGDGHPDNTRTPLIVWGSGISGPEITPGQIAPGHDQYSADWGLDHVARHDVSQADIATLMTYLIGVEFPANSVGELPLPYLSADPQSKARASLANAQAILEIYRVKEERKKSTRIRYQPFPPLSGSGLFRRRIEHIEGLLLAGHHQEAIQQSTALLKTGLEGLRYLQTYDWLFLRALVTVGYLGWIAFAFTTVIDLHVIQSTASPDRDASSLSVFGSVLAVLYAIFALSHAPVTYYAYAFFPVFFWEEVYARRRSLAKGCLILLGGVNSTGSNLPLFLNAVLYIAVIQSLALGYIYREILTVLYIVGAFWPFTYGSSFIQEHGTVSRVWLFSCLGMSVFTLLPAMKVENVALITTGGILMAAVGVLYLSLGGSLLSAREPGSSGTGPRPRIVASTLLGGQIGLVVLAILVTRSSAFSLQRKEGLPQGNQIVGWLVLVVSLLMPVAYRGHPNRHYIHRLMVCFLMFAPTFILLTISYEGLFYVVFSITLAAWVQLEHSIDSFTRVLDPPSSTAVPRQASREDRPFRPLGLADARVALFFFVLLQSAFFSTGNVGSVSSFSLESVYRLIPIFDPFSQGALLVLKLMIPFALVSANLGILNLKLGVAPSALFMVVMAMSDVLTLYFFWVVRDEGSWLEIGSTISHFAIASLLCVFVAALEAVSGLFIAGVQMDEPSAALREPASAGSRLDGGLDAKAE